jgi:hypothetical protein
MNRRMVTNCTVRNNGWTVAHEAAFWGHLPKGFDRWGLADKDGVTVEETLRSCHPRVLGYYGLET